MRKNKTMNIRNIFYFISKYIYYYPPKKLSQKQKEYMFLITG
ncbi:hypothetical protein QOI_0939 [Clostridioides difficile Y21]|nr:hypothetical protein QOI_0939 [Clostridioides difficile Y21]